MGPGALAVLLVVAVTYGCVVGFLVHWLQR
jgi:hypothetical protein